VISAVYIVLLSQLCIDVGAVELVAIITLTRSCDHNHIESFNSYEHCRVPEWRMRKTRKDHCGRNELSETLSTDLSDGSAITDETN